MKKRKILAIVFVGLLLCSCGKEPSFSSTTKNELTSSDAPSSTTSFVSSNKETLNDFSGTEASKSFASRGYEALYKDINFKNGFILSKTSTNAEGGSQYKEYLKYYEETKSYKPFWSLGQWGTRHNLYNNYTLTHSEDGFIYGYTALSGKTLGNTFIPAKRVQFNSKTGEIDLELNAETEYDAPRKKQERWPHLLLGQSFSDNLIHIASSRSIVMEAEFEITKFEDKTLSLADPSLHAAQLVWYITLQNRNKSSDNYGSYVWLGVPLWDNRKIGKETELFAQLDTGTSSLMYNSSTREYYSQFNDSKMPLIHQKAKATFEVVKAARIAYDYAISHGYLGSTKFEDLYIGATNFGFEVSGLYNIGVHIDNIGVYYK